jgi:hypothetical protein
MKTPPELTKENITAILKYIPIFEAENINPDEIYSFMQVLYDNDIIYSFDWPAWEDEAEKLYENPKALASADRDTLRKLLTVHVRKDRFCEGHLAGVIRDGHVLTILKRLNGLLG